VILRYRWGPEIDYPAPLGLSWRSAFTYAVDDWNSTPTLIYFTPGGEDFMFDTYYATDGSRGRLLLMVYDGAGKCIEMRPAGNRGTSQSLYEAEHAANHEMGHGLPLAHSDRSDALMWSAYNAVGVPQQDDINGVNWMYP
jgi:predicted Zn-dependent protease